jgi:hypothetical protein
MDRKLRNNPSEYDLLKLSGLLRLLLIDKPTPLLDSASKAANLKVKFRVIKPGPRQRDPQLQKQMDEAWAKLHETRPEVKRIDCVFAIRGGLLTGEPSEPGDQLLMLARQQFLQHPIGITLDDVEYSVEDALNVVAHSNGGVHYSATNDKPRAEIFRQRMEGATWFGRPMAPAMMFEISRCTLAACKPLADALTTLGLYLPGSSEWVWSPDGHCSVRAEPG